MLSQDSAEIGRTRPKEVTRDYLRLTRVRISPGECWFCNLRGLYFVFVREGNGIFSAGKSFPLLGGGDLLTVVSNGEQRITASRDTAFVFQYFCLSFDHLLPLFSPNEMSLLEGLAERLKIPRVFPAFSSLAGDCHRFIAGIPQQQSLDHRGQLLQIAATVLNDELLALQGGQEGFPSTNPPVVRILEQLSGEELLKLSVSELSQRFACSRRHLNRIFQQHFGVSVATLKMEFRMRKAVSLLRNSKTKVIQVAAECGFNHLGLFNTCFRRRFGSSPNEWRRRTEQVDQATNANLDPFLYRLLDQPSERGETIRTHAQFAGGSTCAAGVNSSLDSRAESKGLKVVLEPHRKNQFSFKMVG